MKLFFRRLFEPFTVHLLMDKFHKSEDDEEKRRIICEVGWYLGRWSTKALINVVKENRDSLLRYSAIILLGKRSSTEKIVEALNHVVEHDLWLTNRQKAEEILAERRT